MPNIIEQRLYNQGLSHQPFTTALEVVDWLGAVQSQDYGGAKWAVAQRTPALTDRAIDKAFADGAILRTHVLRPTWHFVTPADIRWMLTLTAPRIKILSAYYERQQELDEATFSLAHNTMVKALEGGKHLTRAELMTVLEQAGIATGNDESQRATQLMIRAELDGIICSGARRGKQFTYALLDERAPQAKTMTRDESLAELTRRYFTGHGPATLQDFVWWSGLTVSDVKAGIEMVKSQLQQEEIEGKTYWFAASSGTPPSKNRTPTMYLLPNYDEYIVGYTDRSAILDAPEANKLDPRGNILFSHTVVINGRVVGTWRRTFKAKSAVITMNLTTVLNEAEQVALTAAVERLSQFLEMPVVLK